ncbi:putative Deoxycytidylate deaminase [Hypsibius exemplaris]|uniref:dCMP deaminase n=1 Tax=Hypsibius exemplaris TaxID=2072580 RepID=A0A1W0WEG4_HYPEX|nr:putative Deoxycytidylate deaminase [Hypsibius exemplaris]
MDDSNPKRRKIPGDSAPTTADTVDAPSAGPGNGKPRPSSEVLPWPDYYMGVALLTAQRSKDPATQVGACVVNDDGRIIAIGYNGMPCDISDEVANWASPPEDDTTVAGQEAAKEGMICHAALNAIVQKRSVSVNHCTLYTTLFPCNECAKTIIQAGIKKVVYREARPEKEYHKYSRELFEDTKVTLEKYVPHRAGISLALKHDQSPRLVPSSTNFVVAIAPDSGAPSALNRARPIDQYLSYDEYFMGLALLTAQRSKDPKTQVGACVVDRNNRIIGLGYNGMPIGIDDEKTNWGKTPYGDESVGARLASKHSRCQKLILQSGITEVVYLAMPVDKKKGTPEPIKPSCLLLKSVGEDGKLTTRLRQFEYRDEKEQIVLTF